MATHPAIIHEQQEENLYLSRHSLRLENEAINDTTQTIPMTLIATEATAHRDQYLKKQALCECMWLLHASFAGLSACIFGRLMCYGRTYNPMTKWLRRFDVVATKSGLEELRDYSELDPT